MSGEIIFTNSIAELLRKFITELQPTRCVLIFPEGMAQTLIDGHGLKQMTEGWLCLSHPQGEANKNIQTACCIWQSMLEAGVDRKSLVINLGGGLTTDLGGFVAACYMRGIRYINIPTTLLAMVDASSGGKTGVNLDDVKNVVGAFSMPAATIISPEFLKTLPREQILSGWAEMLKHSVLTGAKKLYEYLETDPLTLSPDKWLPLIEESVRFKKGVTDADPKEGGLRRILNLGHTAGHAFEAYFNAHGHYLSHGHAVAVGTITALVLSSLQLKTDTTLLYNFAKTVRRLYPSIPLKCEDYPDLLALMHHDKKNQGADTVNFVLIDPSGKPVQSHPTNDESIRTALDITRDLLWI